MSSHSNQTPESKQACDMRRYTHSFAIAAPQSGSQRSGVKAMLGDLVRLYWAAVYWNLRKTWFRLKRTRGESPCQDPSDSGLANKTRCNAIIHWHDPSRFSRACPLLKQQPDGFWRCSVNAVEVRPFWARAGALFGGSLAILILVTALVTFSMMRLIGYPISIRQIVWPPAWSEINQVRSAYFIAKANHSTAQGKVRESLLSLYNAYELDPANYATGLQLARLWQVNQSENSDLIFQRLMRDHPKHRSETAHLWLRALLARGDYASAQFLAGEQLINHTTPTSAWLHAFIFATRHLPSSPAINEILASPDLSPEARPTLALIAESQTLSPKDQRERLIREVLQNKPNPYTSYYIGRQLLALDLATEALTLALRTDVPLTNHERVLLRLDSLAALNRQSDLLQIFTQALKDTPTDSQVILLCTHLIRHPDANLAAELFKNTARLAHPDIALRYETQLALLCVAGVLRDEPQIDRCIANLRALSGTRFKALESVKNFFLKRTGARHIEIVLPVLQPLPLEITYALLDTMSPR